MSSGAFEGKSATELFTKVNPRTILWQTPFCRSARRRGELLGEPERLARANRERCLELTTVCSTEPYEACHAAVTQAFAGEFLG